MSSRMRMPSGGTKSDADGLRFQALKKPCGLCKKVAMKSIKKRLDLGQRSNWPQVAHSHDVYKPASVISTDLVLGPVVRISRPFYDASNRPPTGSLRVTAIIPFVGRRERLVSGPVTSDYGSVSGSTTALLTSDRRHAFDWWQRGKGECTRDELAFFALNIRSLDWSTVGGGDVPPVTASPAKTPVPLQQPPPAKPADNPAVVDDELAKHKARAERFGIPLVEPKQPPQRQAEKVSQSGPVPDDPEKLKKRAERTGSANTPTQTVKSGLKRAAPVEEVDAEELERRRKRPVRFGTEYPVVY
ncbi:hypothetical protein EDC04DRAFT_2604517 [Pisolithus marmoratus]|nr:hypothetical protein EDC04DRAFT_2604517 [Pisolithus marmoratus]